jgi:hypothetical protein
MYAMSYKTEIPEKINNFNYNMRKEKKFKNNEELEELYKDEEDRNRILSLNEFERERIFAERLQK